MNRNNRFWHTGGGSVLRVMALLILALYIHPVRGVPAMEYSSENQGRILDLFYSPSLIRKMRTDGERINNALSGVNVMSACHYGNRLILGQVDLGDVLDLRIPENHKALQHFARENLLIQNVSPGNHYERYSVAATRFMQELGYHALLFAPDEFHPVFTTPDDTWMFIREDPRCRGEKQEYYYSPQVRNRRIIARGGLPMEACLTPGLEPFYIPVAGSRYKPFELVDSETVEDTENPELVNSFEPIKVTGEMLQKRRDMGLVTSSLSGTQGLPVATWGSDGDGQHQTGLRFTGREDIYTWGDWGFYVIPILPGDKASDSLTALPRQPLENTERNE